MREGGSGRRSPRSIPVEGGWVLDGSDGRGRPLHLAFGETELARAYLGISVGRHPALSERVIEDDTVSRRHVRFGLSEGTLFAEDLNSLNGTVVDGEPLKPFEPFGLKPGAVILLGEVRLVVARLGERPGQR